MSSVVFRKLIEVVSAHYYGWNTTVNRNFDEVPQLSDTNENNDDEAANNTTTPLVRRLLS